MTYFKVSSLKRHLKQQDKMHGNQLAGDGIARAFLKAMVALIGKKSRLFLQILCVNKFYKQSDY